MSYESLKHQIYKAQELWDFASMDRLYKNNLDSYKEAKSDYAKFLYNTAQLKKLHGILKDSSELESFSKIKEKLEIIFNAQDKEDALKQNLPSDITHAYILSQICGGGDYSPLTYPLTATYCLELFKNYLFYSENILLKNYISATLIDYFSLQDSNEFERFFMPKDWLDITNHLLTSIYKSIHEEGAKLYWKKYTLKTQKLLKDNMPPLPPKKIAICFYGVLRGAWEEHLQELIDTMATPLEADVFLFSWDKYQQWPGMTGDPFWAHRNFGYEIAKEIPQEIQQLHQMRELMPHTAKVLDIEISQKIPSNKLESFIKKNQILKRFLLDCEDKYTRCEWSAKLFYGLYGSFKLMESYEFENKFLYDIVIINRVDNKACVIDRAELENMQSYEIADFMDTYGSGSGCIAGYREAIKNYVYQYEMAEFSRQNKYISHNIFHNHEMGFKYPAFLGLSLSKNLIPIHLRDVKITNGYKLPDFKNALKQDLKALKASLSDDRIQAIEAFFKLILEKRGLSSGRQIQKAHNRIQRVMENHLSYKLGKIAFNCHNQGLKGYFKMPFLLIKESLIYQKNQKQYLKKLKAYPFIKQNNIQVMQLAANNGFYRLGAAILKATKNWYKVGYIKLIFEILALKKEFK